MKRKWKIAAAVVCALFLVTVAYAAVSGAGSERDPLVTLSYLTDIFAPKVEKLAKDTVTNQQAQNKSELDSAIQNWDSRVQQAILEAGVSGGSGAAFKQITLEAGKVLVVGEGCEVLLRSGKAAWASESTMTDVTSGGSLANGKALSANHLYMSLGEGSVVVVGGGTTTQPAQTTGTVTASSLNVRSGPGSSNSKVGTLNEGAVVTILGTENGWYKISSGSLNGYVSAEFVTINEAAPEATPAPAASVTLMVRGTYMIR